jgi:hypothetical protein
MSRIGSPLSRRRSASLIWCDVILNGRPIFTPRALARARPSPVRISSRSNSARPRSTVSIRRPWALVVSAHVSTRDRKPAPLSVIEAMVFWRSRVELVKRLAKLAAVRLGSAGRLAEHLLASGLGELAHLRLDALAVRRYPRIPVFHDLDVHLINAPEKPLNFNAPILVRHS